MMSNHRGERSGEGKKPPLDRYIRALEAVAAAPNGLTLTEIATRCRLPSGTAHRIVNVLLGVELITSSRDNPRLLVVGERLHRLVHAGTAKGYLKIAIQPILDKVATSLGNTCFLARLNGHVVESIAWAVPVAGTMRGFLYPEQVMPPHASASAKAILAFQRPALVQEALSAGLPRLTDATLTEVEKIKAEYEQVRRQGYATCWGELEAGLAAIACPIALPELGVVYSVAISGLEERLIAYDLAEVVATLQAAGDELAYVLNAALSAADGPEMHFR